MELTKEQEEAYNAILSGTNVFLTGKAGTGKTFVIEEVLKKLKNAVVLAPTGTAAINAGGETIHKFLKLKAEPPIQKNLKIKVCNPKVLRKANTVIVDEISMCRVDLFDCLISSIQKAEKDYNKKIQIVVVGDFCQLSPVIKKDSGEKEILEAHYQRDICFAFQGDKWKECNFQPFVLTDVMRQEDEEFIYNLNKVRIGDSTCIPYFDSHSSQTYLSDGIYLAGRNDIVDQINKKNLDLLPGKLHTFVARKSGDEINTLAADLLKIKIGAKVMMLCNDPDGNYTNGSFAVVRGIEGRKIIVEINRQRIPISEYEWIGYSYKLINNRIVKEKIGSLTQFPIKLAYAVTIHKSQGQTYNEVNLDPAAWDSGQLYCALSRVRDIKNLYLTQNISQRFLKLDKSVKEFYENLSQRTEKKLEEKVEEKVIIPDIVMENSEYILLKIPIAKKEAVLNVL